MDEEIPKPEEYDDAPQWQKDAWDSDVNKLMRAAADAIPGGGVLDSGGWAMPSEVLYSNYDEVVYPLEFPQVKTERGGVHWPRFRVETMVQPAKRRFLRRRMWQLHIRYWEPASHKNMHHVMAFASEHDARNAEEIIKFAIKNINDQYQEENRAR